jgi:aerobic C4-dicarboxylate transport protein
MRSCHPIDSLRQPKYPRPTPTPIRDGVRPCPNAFATSLQAIVSVLAGVLLDWFDPALGISLKPLGDGFIKLIEMLIAPVVSITIAAGNGMAEADGKTRKVRTGRSYRVFI